MHSIIEQHKEALDQLCKANKVQALFIFGSVLTKEFNAESDIDFVVDIQEKDSLQYGEYYFNILFGLQKLFERKVDLLEMKTLKDNVLGDKINHLKVTLYAA